MNISDAGALLAYASAGDNRTVTKEAALLWSETLRADMTLEEGRMAINSHFANSTEYLKPAHINALVAKVREVRSKELPSVIPPRDLADEPARELEWVRVWGDAVIAGLPVEKAREVANLRFQIVEDEPLAIASAEVERALEEFKEAFIKTPTSLPSRMPKVIRRIPARWAADRGLQILDPDGWRNAGRDFREPCTEAEFDELLPECTVGPFVREDEIKPMSPPQPAPSGAASESEVSA